MLPASKRKDFIRVFGPARVAEIEAAIGERAKEADNAGLEKKARGQQLPDRLKGSFTDWRQKGIRLEPLRPVSSLTKEVMPGLIPPEVKTFADYEKWQKQQDRAQSATDLMSVFGQLVANGGDPAALAEEVSAKLAKVKGTRLKQRLQPAIDKINKTVKELRNV